MDLNLVKVTYNPGTSKIVRYLVFNPSYAIFAKQLHEKQPLGTIPPSKFLMFWIDGDNDKVYIRNEEDFTIFTQLTSDWKLRHIYAELYKTDI